MRVLAITQIWPNALEPLSSPFNLQQFKSLAKLCSLSVLAAVPTFPGAQALGQPERAALLAQLPAQEVIHGIPTTYLRQLYVPKVGVPVAVPLYVTSLLKHVPWLRTFDVLLGTWAYPDGCAAVVVSKMIGKPCVVKVHGSDINVLGRMRSPRTVMKAVLPRADALVSVSKALSCELARLGVPDERVFLVANGVDAKVFAVRDKREARAALGVPLDPPLVTFVGRLEPQKGVGELLEAWRKVRAKRPDAMLALIGEGPLRPEVERLRNELGGVILAPGARPLIEVAQWLAACDVFTLPSWMEGTPNVVLEALASGRPVVASTVGGIPDVLSRPESGILVPPRDATALADALARALERPWEADAIRATGPGSWDDSAGHLLTALESAARGRSADPKPS